jgi:hypothetical protein
MDLQNAATSDSNNDPLCTVFHAIEECTRRLEAVSQVYQGLSTSTDEIAGSSRLLIF